MAQPLGEPPGDLAYLDQIVIARPGNGTQHPSTGVWSGAGNPPWYDGPADVQDSGTALSRDPEGTPVQVADAVAFIPPPFPVGCIPAESPFRVSYRDGSTMMGQVIRARRLDGAVFLRITGL